MSQHALSQALLRPAILAALVLTAVGCPPYDEDDDETCSGIGGGHPCPPLKPDNCICTQEYAPVCGEDGKTYGNACEARCADQSIDHRGECENACTCTLEYSPVCGANDKTYGNACEARCAKQTIAHAGECRSACACTREYDPVCGDDDETYENRCLAKCEGVTVAHEGACESTSGGCDLDGQHYALGDRFTGEDGCSTCTCGVGGSIACSAKSCDECNYDQPGRTWAGKTRAECDPIRFQCERGKRPFSNHCGCGCEPATSDQPRCKVGGCSGQLCVSEDAPDIVTTCEWREVYACFDDATCEVQSDGACGWTQTPELRACIAQAQ